MMQDLAQRSDDKAKGVNKFSFLEVIFIHSAFFSTHPYQEFLLIDYLKSLIKIKMIIWTQKSL